MQSETKLPLVIRDPITGNVIIQIKPEELHPVMTKEFALMLRDGLNAIFQSNSGPHDCKKHLRETCSVCGHVWDGETIQSEGDRFAPVQAKLAAYETLLDKGKMVQDSGGWHDQQAFNEWNRLVTLTNRDLCRALAAIVGERLMNAVLCIEGNGWSFEPDPAAVEFAEKTKQASGDSPLKTAWHAAREELLDTYRELLQTIIERGDFYSPGHSDEQCIRAVQRAKELLNG